MRGRQQACTFCSLNSVTDYESIIFFRRFHSNMRTWCWTRSCSRASSRCTLGARRYRTNGIVCAFAHKQDFRSLHRAIAHLYNIKTIIRGGSGRYHRIRRVCRVSSASVFIQGRTGNNTVIDGIGKEKLSCQIVSVADADSYVYVYRSAHIPSRKTSIEIQSSCSIGYLNAPEPI